MTEIRVGPAGWSYDDWKGKVYPEPAGAGFDALAYLSGFFSTLEVNSTFYRPAPPKMSEAWARRTPQGFLFTVKAWEKFTHDTSGFQPAEVRTFQEGLIPLLQAGKLGALLIQFPWFFKDVPASRDRIRRVVEALGEWAPLVLEVRHRSWLDAFDFLAEQRLCFCNIDQPKSSTAITGTHHVTGPVGYVRLHGRNAKAWFSKTAGRDQKYDYLYSADELKEWVGGIQGMKADRIFVITNNHFQGKAVVNALQLMRALGMETSAPDPLKAAYPGVL